MSPVSTWRSGSSSFAPADSGAHARALVAAAFPRSRPRSRVGPPEQASGIPVSYLPRPARAAKTTRPERAVATLLRATGRNPHTWSYRSQVAQPASELPACWARRRSGTGRARSLGRSRSSSDVVRARPPVEKAEARRNVRTEAPPSPLQVFRECESRIARHSWSYSGAARAPSNPRSKCPVRRSFDLFVQLTDLALNTSHRVVSRHLGFSQESHLPWILVRHAGSAERERVAVQAIRVGSVLAQCRKRRLQTLAASFQLGCALSQVVVSRDVRPARLLLREGAELRLPARSRPVRQWPHACECRSDSFCDKANDHVSSTLRPLCSYLPHESGRTQERHRVRLAANHPITRMWLVIVPHC